MSRNPKAAATTPADGITDPRAGYEGQSITDPRAGHEGDYITYPEGYPA